MARILPNIHHSPLPTPSPAVVDSRHTLLPPWLKARTIPCRSWGGVRPSTRHDYGWVCV